MTDNHVGGVQLDEDTADEHAAFITERPPGININRKMVQISGDTFKLESPFERTRTVNHELQILDSLH